MTRKRSLGTNVGAIQANDFLRQADGIGLRAQPVGLSPLEVVPQLQPLAEQYS